MLERREVEVGVVICLLFYRGVLPCIIELVIYRGEKFELAFGVKVCS